MIILPRAARGLVAGLLALSGCVVIPVNYHAAGSRTNVRTETRSELHVGVTTREEVLLLLGEPDVASEDGQVLGYAWTKVGAIVIVTGGYGGGGAAGEIGKSFALKLTFDADDRLAEVDLLRNWWSHQI